MLEQYGSSKNEFVWGKARKDGRCDCFWGCTVQRSRVGNSINFIKIF
jgi:hypothetical protein